MSFIENAGGEIIGGIVGGLVALFAMSIWYKFRTFQLYYLDPQESITAEHMREYTAIRTETGCCHFRVRLRPRIGLELEKYSFAFFDKGKVPCSIGRRRSTSDIKIYKMRHLGDNEQQFHDENLKIDKEGSYSTSPMLSLPRGSCVYFGLEAQISDALKSWEGILSFQIHYVRDGNPDKKNVRTKFIVKANDKPRPLRSVGKKVLKAVPVPPASEREGSQSQ